MIFHTFTLLIASNRFSFARARLFIESIYKMTMMMTFTMRMCASADFDGDEGAPAAPLTFALFAQKNELARFAACASTFWPFSFCVARTARIIKMMLFRWEWRDDDDEDDFIDEASSSKISGLEYAKCNTSMNAHSR